MHTMAVSTDSFLSAHLIGEHLVHVEVGADPREADLPAPLGHPLRLEQVLAHLLRLGLVVEVPDVEVVGPQLAQARVQVGEGFRPGPPHALAREDHLLTHALEGAADHPLVVAVLVDAGGVEVVDPQIRRARDHGRLRSGHAAEGERRDLEAGPAQRAVGRPDGLRPGRVAFRRERGVAERTKAGRGKHEARGQEVATGEVGFHRRPPCLSMPDHRAGRAFRASRSGSF
jgi:hypothetical protein